MAILNQTPYALYGSNEVVVFKQTGANSITAEQFNAISVGDIISGTGSRQPPPDYILSYGTVNLVITGKEIATEMDWMTEEQIPVYKFYTNAEGNQYFLNQGTEVSISYTPAPSGVTIPASSVFNGNALVTGATSNPTVVEFRLANNDPLPVGSVVKMASGQKFVKIPGDVKVFATIPVTPDAEWGWDQAGLDAWGILQNL